LGQANRFIKAEAGFFSFAAPKVKGLVLHFAAPESVLVGESPFNSEHDGSLKLPFDDGLLKSNPLVQLSARPTSVDFIE